MLKRSKAGVSKNAGLPIAIALLMRALRRIRWEIGCLSQKHRLKYHKNTDRNTAKTPIECCFEKLND